MSDRNAPVYSVQEDILKNLVLVDGITRCGKSLFSHVIGTFENFEHLQFVNPLEHIVPGIAFGLIDIGFAKAFMRSHLNETAYNTLLSRNSNFRPDDQTGVVNHPKNEMYQARLRRPDGDNVVDELRSGQRVFPFMTHDMMVNLQTLNSLEIDYKMIEIYRDPVMNVRSCFQRGWGVRYGADPRAFTLNVSYKKELVPWYAVGSESLWLDLSPLEKCVWMVTELLNRSISQQRTYGDERIFTVSFEDFVTKTDDVIINLTEFLGHQPTSFTSQQLSKANCPRILDLVERNNAFLEIRKGIRSELFEKFEILNSDFESGTYGLSSWKR